MLHGVTWLHVDATPICDFRKSAHENPTACSIARLAARSTPSVTACDHFRCRLSVFRVCIGFSMFSRRIEILLRLAPPRNRARFPDAACPAPEKD
jgi:hypothetical protein